MLHPIEDDLSIYSNQELEQKVTELTKKYFRQRNPEVKQQMQQLLDMYKMELRERIQKEQRQKLNLDLDKLINIE
jgi:16S rRNA A1518/A1519 N6-dimethyltransferase RsmA/KsgA/DIM1 with predicted DNA glycosylase/AP lyase activity|tara:strand:- start:1275 stop:1499 length:225 start_codon:yes stop_codon:yes gene_type:complete